MNCQELSRIENFILEHPKILSTAQERENPTQGIISSASAQERENPTQGIFPTALARCVAHERYNTTRFSGVVLVMSAF